MKHRKLLLLALLLTFFAVQQAQVGAETVPNASIPSFSELDYKPPSTVKVTYFPLKPSGVRDDDGLGNLLPQCIVKRNNNNGDRHFGCTDRANTDLWWYPYSANAFSDPIETDYLLNVLIREMSPGAYPNPQSLMAQAVASRTYAYKKNTVNNTASNFQFDVPYAFINYLYVLPPNGGPPPFPEPSDNLCGQGGLNAGQRLVCDAVAGKYYMSYNGGPIDAEYGSDVVGATVALTSTTYLKSVQEPISTTCDANNSGNGWGMSQEGANRWDQGNQCAINGGPSTKWIAKWRDYRQILTHYYSGIDIIDAINGGALRPDDRWNLLNFNDNNPVVMSPATVSTFNVFLQNTGKTSWNANDIVMGYQWSPVGGGAQDGNWQVAVTIGVSVLPGDSLIIAAVPVTAPTNNGVYDLHLDLKRSGSFWWFSFGGQWPDAIVSQVNVTCGGQACASAQITLGSDDAGIDQSLCTFDIGRNEVYFGFCNSGAPITSGFRFQNLNIAQGRVIQNAYVAFTVDGPYSNQVTVTLDGELNTNAPTYSPTNQPDNPSRVLTGYPVTWSINEIWSLGQTRNTPNLAPFIQPIVNQGGWISGNNAISIVVKNGTPSTSHRRVISYERAASDPSLKPAILVVGYTP